MSIEYIQENKNYYEEKINELNDKVKYYQNKTQRQNKETERLNNIIKEIRKMLYKKTLDEYDTYTANIVCDFQSDFEEIVRLNGGDEE
jgi:N-acetyl-anhydromuramyl-L-alanine amidase AmpD